MLELAAGEGLNVCSPYLADGCGQTRKEERRDRNSVIKSALATRPIVRGCYLGSPFCFVQSAVMSELYITESPFEKETGNGHIQMLCIMFDSRAGRVRKDA